MSCMYPRKKMKPVQSKKEKLIADLKTIGGIAVCVTGIIGVFMATPTLFNTINPVGARDNTPTADISVYKDKTSYGTCEYIVVETSRQDGGVSITPRMKHNDSLNGSEHICRK